MRAKVRPKVVIIIHKGSLIPQLRVITYSSRGGGGTREA